MALQDRMHQPYRACLIPGFNEMLALRRPGLLGCALSGAGPSVLVFYERGSEHVTRGFGRPVCAERESRPKHILPKFREADLYWNHSD